MARTNRLENIQTLRLANADGAFATAFGTLCGGAFLVGFIRLLGGSDLWINLLTAIPSLIGVLQIFGAAWGRSFASYKRFVAPGGATWRLLYIPIVFLPLLHFAPQARLIILAVCIAVASACVVMVNPTYNEWLAELVPADSRGFFFSRRNAILTAVGATVGLFSGFLLDWFKKGRQEAPGYSVIFGLGVLCALISLAMFLRMRDLPRTNVVQTNIGNVVGSLKGPFSDPNFRRFLLFQVMFIFGQGFSGNLFNAFGLESLKVSFTVLQGLALTNAAGNVLTATMWGFLADKYGNKPVLTIGALGVVLTPSMWLFCMPGRDLMNAMILIPSHVVVGAIWAAVGIAQFNLLLVTAKAEDRGTYIAAGLATQAIVGGIAPLVGAGLMAELRHFFEPAIAYKWVFGATMSLRLLAVFFLSPIKEEGSKRFGQAIGEISRVTPKGYRALRSLTKIGTETARERAIQSVATEKFALASDEIIKALHDPAPRVRRQAASALARLQDPNAVQALLHQLQEHPDLVEEETVEALGDLGSPLAAPELIKLLQSPRSAIRRAAVRSLGRVGGAESVEALIATAAEPSDADLRRASLRALRSIGAKECEGIVSESLLDQYPSVRIAAAECVSDLQLRGAVANVRESLARFQDEASSEVAYALGVVGSMDDLPLILQTAAQSVSVIPRRRCLMGAAHLLGIEHDSYRLMLLEGMSRDNAILEELKVAVKLHPRLKAALDRFSNGDEAGALRVLAQTWKTPIFATLAENPVEELFLVGVLYGANQDRAR